MFDSVLELPYAPLEYEPPVVAQAAQTFIACSSLLISFTSTFIQPEQKFVLLFEALLVPVFLRSK
jgi:hypothetical protein